MNNTSDVDQSSFRNYPDSASGTDGTRIADTYKKARMNQTVDYVQRMHQKYLKFNKKMLIWDIFDELDKLVDSSDPDLLGVSNVHHLIQTAEGLRKDGYPEDIQLTGLLHDLGKILYKWGCDEDGTTLKEQWGLVGDTFVVGCKIPDVVVYPEFNSLNPDMSNPNYNTELGIYQQNCGLDNVLVSFGHDEYLYQVLQHPNNKNSLSDECKYIVRFHSLYPWHDKDAYSYLESEKDRLMKPYVKQFNTYDLYTKEYTLYNLDDYREYYGGLFNKYFESEYLYL